MTTVDRAIANALTAGAQAQGTADQPEVVIVTVPPNSRLESLLCMEDRARDAHNAAEANWAELKSAITAECQALYPGTAGPTKAFEIPAKPPMWAGLTIAWRDGKEYLPTDLIKQHIPQIWTAFKKRSKGFWDFRRAKR
jgi:hypothetical protein